VRVALLLSPVLECLSSVAFFSVMEGLIWIVCYGGFTCLIWRVLLSHVLEFLLSLLVGYMVFFYQIWSIPCCPFLWSTFCSCLVMVYTMKKLFLSPYDRDQTLEV
jgi:hypothetical protein